MGRPFYGKVAVPYESFGNVYQFIPLPLRFEEVKIRPFADVDFIGDVAEGTVVDRIYAHRFMLANGSKYFEAFFEDRWHRDEPMEPVLGVKHGTLEKLVSYMYGTELLVFNMVDALDVLQGAQYLQMTTNLIKRLEMVLLNDYLNNTTSVELFCFADVHDCAALKIVSAQVIARFLPEIINCSRFECMTVSEFDELFRHLGEVSVDLRVRAALQWLFADKRREAHVEVVRRAMGCAFAELAEKLFDDIAACQMFLRNTNINGEIVLELRRRLQDMSARPINTVSKTKAKR